MNDLIKHPCSTDPDCCALPAEFVRLRYFFGQRLNVVDFTDEQRYVVGKQRFHNARAHGAGVLCGLRAERFVVPAGAPPNTTTTVLRVVRGAGYDGCGREIVMGWDHCVDVAAWYRKHVEDNPDLAAWQAGDVAPEDRVLYLAICYRECDSDPTVAPRDPCGCDTGGCEFSRVREGFSLELLTASERDRCLVVPPALPAWSALEAVDGAAAEADHRRIAEAVAGDCPELDADKCLCLASVLVELDAQGEQVVNIAAPDNAIAERLSLLSTRALQGALATLRQTLGAEAISGPGPRFGALSFSGPDATSGTLQVAARLVEDGPGPVPIAGDPIPSLTFAVHRFADDGTWHDVTPAPAEITFTAAPDPVFELEWTTGLQDQGRYRLVVEAATEPPVVDARMRPLMPRRFVRHFRLQANASSVLELSPTLYDA